MIVRRFGNDVTHSISFFIASTIAAGSSSSGREIPWLSSKWRRMLATVISCDCLCDFRAFCGVCGQTSAFSSATRPRFGRLDGDDGHGFEDIVDMSRVNDSGGGRDRFIKDNTLIRDLKLTLK